MRRLPALVAAVTGDDGAVTGVQRTWLDPRSPAKAGVASPRKALGRIYGLAVRFGRPADGASLLVGEGIETVLSLVTAVPEITAAAALSAGSLGAFAPPPGVARLVIARDNDDEGEQAAMRLARRCARAGVAALVVVPEGDDFNDDLVALGPDTLGARMRRPLRPVRGRAKPTRGRIGNERRESMSPLTYAGIGARKTPEPVLAVMRRMAWYLASKGWHLNTGGADGADSAFAEGSPSLRTVFLPWRGYNGWSGPGCVSFGDRALAKLYPFAAAHHDAWERCSPAVRKLHARNVAIIGGVPNGEPVRAVICWTRAGARPGARASPSASHDRGHPGVQSRDGASARRVHRDEPARRGRRGGGGGMNVGTAPARGIGASPNRSRPSRYRGQRVTRPRTVNPCGVLHFVPAASR